MGRSRNPLNEDGSVGKKHRILPPCRVCNAPAAGFHYGANTCEACKAFFHRSIRRHNLYKCEEIGRCEIVHTKSFLCKQCRYRKCLGIGMSVGAIRTGRYTKLKKTRDHMELLDLIQQAGHVDDLVADLENFAQSSTTKLMGAGDGKVEVGVTCTQLPNFIDPVWDMSPCPPRPEPTRSVLGQPVRSQTSNFPSNHRQMPLSKLVDEFSMDCDLLTDSHTIKEHKYTDNVPHAEHYSPKSPDHQLQRLVEAMTMSLGEEKPPVSVSNAQSFCPAVPSSRGEDISSGALNPGDREFHRMLWLQSTEENISKGESVCDPLQNSLFGRADVKVELRESTCSMSPPSLAGSSDSALTSLELDQGSEPPQVCLSAPLSQGLPATKQCISRETSSALDSTQSIYPTRQYISKDAFTAVDSAKPASSEGPLFSKAECKCVVFNGQNSIESEKSSRMLYDVCLSRLYQDKESVIAQINTAKHDFLDPLFGYQPQKMQQQEIKDHLAKCKVKTRMSGFARRIPNHAEGDIWIRKGIDIDRCKAACDKTLRRMVAHVRSIANFAQRIPGFSRIPSADKINLIKQCRSELMFASVYPNFNTDHTVGAMCDNIMYCRTCAMNECTDGTPMKLTPEDVDTHFGLAYKFKKLGLLPTENALLHAIVLMRPDRHITPQDPAVGRIHSHLVDCLRNLLQRRSPHPDGLFSTIVTLLDEIRDHAEKTMNIYRHLSIGKYSSNSGSKVLHALLR